MNNRSQNGGENTFLTCCKQQRLCVTNNKNRTNIRKYLKEYRSSATQVQNPQLMEIRKQSWRRINPGNLNLNAVDKLQIPRKAKQEIYATEVAFT